MKPHRARIGDVWHFVDNNYPIRRFLITSQGNRRGFDGPIGREIRPDGSFGPEDFKTIETENHILSECWIKVYSFQDELEEIINE